MGASGGGRGGGGGEGTENRARGTNRVTGRWPINAAELNLLRAFANESDTKTVSALACRRDSLTETYVTETGLTVSLHWSHGDGNPPPNTCSNVRSTHARTRTTQHTHRNATQHTHRSGVFCIVTRSQMHC